MGQGRFLEIFGVPYLIYMILIPMGDVCEIAGMDWLSKFRFVNDCDGHQEIIWTPSRGELFVYGEGTILGSPFGTAARARQHIHHICIGYHAYVVDT